MMRKAVFVIPIIFSFIIISCGSSSVFEQNLAIENGQWAEDDIKTFEFNISDITNTYNIYHSIRNTVSYPFQNIYFTATLEDENGKVINSDLKNMDLFDRKTGKPMGSGLGDVFDLQVLSLENFKFEKAGNYKLKIQQYMRKDTLTEILSVGIKIEQATK